MNVTITVSRDKIFDELARTASYLGAKQPDSDNGTFDRMSLTEADAKLLQRFWHESHDRLCLTLRRHIDSEGIDGDVYRMDLTLSSAFDTKLIDSIESGVANYYIQSIAAKWLTITDPGQAAEYLAAADASLDYIACKCYCKRHPIRPKY